MRYKNKILTFILLSLLTFMSTTSFAVSEGKKSPDSAVKKKKDPIEVTSEKMRSENKGEKIIFTGNVVSLWDDIEVKSDALEVNNPKGAEGGTDQIVATGNVIITRGVKKAKGDKAVYLDKEQKIILTSDTKVIAWEDKDMIEGKEMIFLLDKDRFLVNDRVRMKFYPKDKDETESGEKSSAKNKAKKK